jgi:hypothetical protein
VQQKSLFCPAIKTDLIFGKNGAGTSVANQDLSNQDSRPAVFVDQN